MRALVEKFACACEFEALANNSRRPLHAWGHPQFGMPRLLSLLIMVYESAAEGVGIRTGSGIILASDWLIETIPLNEAMARCLWFLVWLEADEGCPKAKQLLADWGEVSKYFGACWNS